MIIMPHTHTHTPFFFWGANRLFQIFTKHLLQSSLSHGKLSLGLVAGPGSHFQITLPCRSTAQALFSIHSTRAMMAAPLPALPVFARLFLHSPRSSALQTHPQSTGRRGTFSGVHFHLVSWPDRVTKLQPSSARVRHKFPV